MGSKFRNGPPPRSTVAPQHDDGQVQSNDDEQSCDGYVLQADGRVDAPWVRAVGTSTITADKNMFKVILDVQQFKPEEISVKLADRFVVVEAKHEEKRDQHGLISRQFMRKYMLPEQMDEMELSSNISSDGIFDDHGTVEADRREAERANDQDRDDR